MGSNLNLKGMNDNNLDISAKEDAGLYFTALSCKDIVFVIKDNLSCKSIGLKVTLSTGQGCIQGHHFTSLGGAFVNVNPNTEGFIVVEFDKSKSLGLEFNLLATPIIVKQDILNNGLKRQLELYKYKASETTLILSDNRSYFSVGDVTNITASNSKKFDGKEVKDFPSQLSFDELANKIDDLSSIDIINLISINWSDTAPFKQTINVTGITENSYPIPSILRSGTDEEKKLQKEQFSFISEGITKEGQIEFICDDDKPTIELHIILKGK